MLWAFMVSTTWWTTSALRDEPISADSAVSLNGQWSLVGHRGAPAPAPPTPGPVPPSNPSCTWKADTDYGSHQSPNTGHPFYAATKEECCGACNEDPTCAVGVFLGRASQCWVKTANESAVPRAHEGVMACVKVPGHPNPPAPPPAPPSPVPPPPPLGTTIAAIKGTVPGDLITDLQVAGLIPEPYFENNFLNASLWNDNTWVYTTSFTLTEMELTSMRAGGTSKLLVFDGIKMGAHVAVNGKVVGVASDEFLRYEWPLDAALHMLDANNKLEVTFDASIDCGGRWMACAYSAQHCLLVWLCLCL